LLRNFDAVISLSPRTRKDFLSTYRFDPQRVFIIPNAVDDAPFRTDEPSLREHFRKMLRLQTADKVVINVAGLSPEKNQVELLVLVHDLLAEGLRVKLLLVGEGPLRRTLTQKAKHLGIDGSVRFLGARDDVPALLAAADLFVLPSKTESMPASLIESGMAGLAAVVYDVGAVTDVIEDEVTGVVLPDGDYPKFKEAVLDLLQHENRRRDMGMTAKAHYLERFGLEEQRSSSSATSGSCSRSSCAHFSVWRTIKDN